jgi:TctA family transporter
LAASQAFELSAQPYQFFIGRSIRPFYLCELAGLIFELALQFAGADYLQIRSVAFRIRSTTLRIRSKPLRFRSLFLGNQLAL